MKREPGTRPTRRADFEESDGDTTRDFLRDRFLDAVKRVEPAVLASLAGEPLQLFLEAEQRVNPDGDIVTMYLILNRGGYVVYDRGFPPRPTGEWTPAFEPLRRSLLAWGDRWHLDTPWCIEVALRTLWQWSWSENGRCDWRRPSANYNTPYGLGGDRFNTFKYAQWNPLAERAEEGWDYIMEKFKEHLAAEFDRIRQDTRIRGFLPVKDKRSSEHFEWLVQYHVKRRRYAEIAATALPGGEATIAKAVRDLAGAIVLPLDQRRGRPRRAGPAKTRK